MSFSSRFGKSLLATSMESEAATEVAEVVDAIEAEDADNVEGALVEATIAEGEVAETSDAIEAGAQDAETLTAIADTLEETEQEGGADPVTAQVAQVAVEAIYARLGIKTPAMHSMESFGDKATRQSATHLSVESIRENAAKLWKAIVELFQRVKTSVVAFLKALFSANERAIKRAEKLKAAAAEAKGAPKEETVTGGFMKILGTSKTFNKADALKTTAGLADYATAVAKVSTEIAKHGENLDVAKLIADKDAYEKFIAIPAFKATKLADTPKKLFGLKDDEDSAWGALADPIGGIYVAMRLPVAGVSNPIAASKVKVTTLNTNTEALDKDAKAPALNKAEVVQLVDNVLDGL